MNTEDTLRIVPHHVLKLPAKTGASFEWKQFVDDKNLACINIRKKNW